MAEKLDSKAPELCVYEPWHVEPMMPATVVTNLFGIKELWISRTALDGASRPNLRLHLAVALIRADPKHRKRAALDHFASLAVLSAATLLATFAIGILWSLRWTPLPLIGVPFAGAYFIARREARIYRLVVVDAVEMTGEADAALKLCRTRGYVKAFGVPLRAWSKRGAEREALDLEGKLRKRGHRLDVDGD